MKKILSLIIAILMLISLVPTVSAAGNWGSGTTVTYTGTGAESWTVTVPADMAPGDSADVVASGTWASNRKLTVTADNSVRLVNNLNMDEYKDLDVTFANIELVGSNTTEVSATEEVSVEGISDALFGTWSGKFNYNVEIADYINTPLKFGEKYIAYSSDGGFNEYDYFIFHADGSVNGQDGYIAHATYSETEVNIFIEAIPITITLPISADGTQLSFDEYNKYVLITELTEFTVDGLYPGAIHNSTYMTFATTWEQFVNECSDARWYIKNDDNTVRFHFPETSQTWILYTLEDSKRVHASDLIINGATYEFVEILPDGPNVD